MARVVVRRTSSSESFNNCTNPKKYLNNFLKLQLPEKIKSLDSVPRSSELKAANKKPVIKEAF